jgi:gluconate 2-dehydrogenase gamma chain
MLSRRNLLRFAALAAFAKRGRAAPAIDTFAVLDAAAARIIPSDDGPGAREAKVGRFIEKQLLGDLRDLRPAFDRLAMLLDFWSQRTLGKDFLEITPQQQDRVLDSLARGQIPVRGVPQEALFRGLHSLTLEGFLSDPVHGGNDGEIGWRSIGFPTPHLRHVH